MSNATTLIEQGRKAIYENKANEAEQAFRQALETDANSVEAMTELARILIAKGRLQEADPFIQTALAGKPNDGAALSLKGILLLASGKPKEAASVLEKAVLADPKSDIAYVNLGIARRELKQLPESEKNLRKAIELKPNNFEAHYCLGFTLGLSNRLEEAIREVLKAVEINPVFQQGYVVLGELMTKGKQLDTAEMIYKEGLKHDPSMIVLRDLLAGLYAERGNFSDAQSERTEIAERRGDASDWIELGKACVANRKHEEAVAALQKAVAISPRNWRAHYYLAEIFDLAGRNELSQREYEISIRYSRNNFRPHNGLGLLMLKQNKIGGAIEQFEKAVAFAPKSAVAKYNLGLAMSKARKSKQAAKLFQDVVENPAAGPLKISAQKFLKSMAPSRPMEIRI